MKQILSTLAVPKQKTKKTAKDLLEADNGAYFNFDYLSLYFDRKNTDTAKRLLLLALAEKMSLEGGNFRRKSALGMGDVPISYSYDARGRIETISQGTNRTYTFGYDTDGDLVSITDPLTRTVGFDHDALGRVTKRVLPDLREIYIGHDPNGNVTSIQPPSRPHHELTYTPINTQENYIPPDISIGPPQTHYDYNLDKQLTTITRPDGKIINLFYNVITGMLEQVVIPRGNVDFTYYPTTGKINTITAPGSESLTYTYNGSFKTETTFAGTINGTISRSYNNNFQLESRTINGTDTINYGYDNDGLLTSIGSLYISRDATNGMILGTSFGNITDLFGYTDTLTTENYGEVANYTALYSTTSLYNVLYERDHLGRITKKTETIDGTTTVFQYAYYQNGKLHTVTKDGTLISTYIYDDNGNRLSYTPETGSAVTGTYDDQDRLLTYGNATFIHTKNGELLTKTDGTDTTTYQYDVLGNLISVELPNGDFIEYIIDASNRRIGKKVNGTLVQGFLYDSQLHPIAELDGSGDIVAIFGPGFMIKSGTFYRFITDHLGSIRFVVDSATNTIAQQIDYDEYGNVLTDTNPGFQPFGYASGLYDHNTALVRFGARDYDPDIGRWILKDPINFRGGQSNLYVYVHNDPVNSRDSLGLGRFCFRPLSGNEPLDSTPDGMSNYHRAHENYWLDDDPDVDDNLENFGFFRGPSNEICGEQGSVRPDFGHPRAQSEGRCLSRYYNDDIMLEAMTNIADDWEREGYCLKGRNCQHFAEALRNEYGRISKKRADENAFDAMVSDIFGL